jgi:hypothetical protein
MPIRMYKIKKEPVMLKDEACFVIYEVRGHKYFTVK